MTQNHHQNQVAMAGEDAAASAAKCKSTTTQTYGPYFMYVASFCCKINTSIFKSMTEMKVNL